MSRPKHSIHQRSATRRLIIEMLEERRLLATVGIDLNQVLQTVSTDMLGTNVTYWQWELSSSQMQQMVRDSGMKLFRMPGGSGSNYNLHFNNPPPYNGYNTAPMIAKFIENVGGDGMVTINYGTGSPQEAAAYLSYLNAQPSDTTAIGMGQQWNDTTRVWVMKDWKTAGYWASLRAAAPLGTDDGLNFLRISHSAPFNFTYFEVGNEDFATWEYDKHNLGGTASASSTVGSGQTADMAFDENTATKWVGNWTSSPNYPWLMYQFPNNDLRAVRWYTITSSADIATNPGRAPKSWQFQGSNNGTTWITLDTRTNQANTTNATAWNYQTTNTTPYKYYRLNITANNGDANYVEIGDFKLQAADPDTYTTFAKTFSDLAHQIDPSVKVGIDTNQPMQWNMPDLNWVDDCLAMGLQKNFVPDFLSDHTYVTGQSDSNLLLHTINDPNFKGYQNVPADWAGKAAWYRSKLNANLGTTLAAGVELMETEFNCDLGTKQSTSLVSGLWMADAIGGLMQTEFTAALQWDLTNGYNAMTADPNYYGWREGSDNGMISTGTNAPPTSGPYIPYPVYFTEQLWSKIVQNGSQIVSVNSSDPNLTTYAIREQDGTVGLMVINKSLNSDLSGTFYFTGFTPNTSATYWQYGRAEDTAQSQSSNGSAALSTGIAPLLVDGSSFEYSFPSYSMTVIILSPGIPLTQPPQAPSNLIAAELSSGRINLSWTDNGNSETMFKIERSPNGSHGLDADRQGGRQRHHLQQHRPQS